MAAINTANSGNMTSGADDGRHEGLHARMERVSARMQLASKHEKIAVELAQHFDRGSVTKAAAHFTIADALRSRARFA